MFTERSVEEGRFGAWPPVLLFGSFGSRVIVGKKPAFTEARLPVATRARALDIRCEGDASQDVSPSASASVESPTSNSSPRSGTDSPVSPSVPRSAHIPLGIGLGLGAGAGLGNASPSKAICLRSPWSSGFGGRKQQQKTVLIMMSNTGGGHKASAEALASAFKELYGARYRVVIVDMWKHHTPQPFNNLPDTYSFLVKHAILWRLSYQITQPAWFHIPYMRFCALFCARGIDAALDLYRPDLVVSVHPLMQHIPLAVIKQRTREGRQWPIHFTTVVTDFTTCHNTWFHKGVSKCFVATPYCRDLALRNGLRPDQVVLHGLPIRPVFSKRLPCKKVMKKRLKLDCSLPAVLLVGGGEGMGRLQETVLQLDAQVGSACQVVVICGRNRALQQRLAAWAAPSGMRVTALGFVDNVHEWMAAADLIITKAGPGTIAEALISGLPILLNGNVPCQEEGNIPYVVDNEVGGFETRPAKIAGIVQEWLGPQRQEFAAMAARSKALGRPEAVYNIVRDLAALCDTAPATDDSADAEAPLTPLPAPVPA